MSEAVPMCKACFPDFAVEQQRAGASVSIELAARTPGKCLRCDATTWIYAKTQESDAV